MSSPNSLPANLNRTRDYKRELDDLYARRIVIDSVITSLEAYDRHRAATAVRDGQRKSA